MFWTDNFRADGFEQHDILDSLLIGPTSDDPTHKGPTIDSRQEITEHHTVSFEEEFERIASPSPRWAYLNGNGVVISQYITEYASS